MLLHIAKEHHIEVERQNEMKLKVKVNRTIRMLNLWILKHMQKKGDK